MASSKVMASASPPNPDLPRHSPSSSSAMHHHFHLHSSPSSSSSFSIPRQHQQQLLVRSSNDHSRNFDSMNMEEILKNFYSCSDGGENNGGGGSAVDGGGAAVGGGGGGCGVGGKTKTVDEVWREIVSGGGGGGGGNREPVQPEMTLEDFLSKAGAVTVAEEDVRVPAAGFGVETMMNSVQFQPGMHMQNGPPLGFGNGMVAVGGGSGGSGRGKRRAVEEAPLDKATQQKQRRMIKNRESAARSRERKQAYTVELESLVTQLEEENARLLKEEAELNKRRYKQLMENLIPVTEKRRPTRVLRRVHSISW